MARFFKLFLTLTLALFIGACSEQAEETPAPEAPAATESGEGTTSMPAKAEEAMEEAGDAVEEAGDAAEGAADAAVEEGKEAMEEAGDAVEEAGDAVEDATDGGK